MFIDKMNIEIMFYLKREFIFVECLTVGIYLARFQT